MKKTHSVKSFLAVIIIVFVFSACAKLTLTHVSNLRKGMTIQESQTSLNRSYQREFILNNISSTDKIIVRLYILSSGDYESNYFLAFVNDKLIFWGYPHEFARSQDELINKIGSEAVKQLQERKMNY